MVSSTVCFSKYLSDKPTVSRVVPGPGFPIWYWLRGKGWDILKNMTKNCMRTTNSAFSGKTIKETGEDKPIFVVLKGFPHPAPSPPPHKTNAWTLFLPFSPQEVLVLIWSTSEGWKVELTLEHWLLHPFRLPTQFSSLLIDFSNFAIPSDNRDK